MGEKFCASNDRDHVDATITTTAGTVVSSDNFQSTSYDDEEF
jgi:hypothetical protein